MEGEARQEERDTWIPGSVEGGSCPLSPLARQRGQALSVSSVTGIALQQHLLPFSSSLTVPAACGSADQNLVRNLDGVRDLVYDGVKLQV